MELILPPIQPARPEWQALTPVSTDYRDHYFTPGQGEAESLAVFIGATDLNHRFAALDAGKLFVIGETGFGTGLNCLLASQCFLQRAPAGARLHLYSAERHPLRLEDLERALSQWPRLRALSESLSAQYPPPAPGFHRVQLHERITLTLMFGDAATLWARCDAEVDAWFLDGFAPDRNPDMWSAELFAALAKRSRPGCRLGTFTAAGHVRRNLQAAGFEVERATGFAGKRHRLTGAWPGDWKPQQTRRGRVLVAGAGLAGATTTRALAERGWQVTVIDPFVNPTDIVNNHLAAVLHATPSDHLRPQNRFYQSSLIAAMNWLRQLDFPQCSEQGRLDGVVFHAMDKRDQKRLRAAIDTGAWPVEMIKSLAPASALIQDAGYLNPIAWCQVLLTHPAIETVSGRLAHFDADAAVTLESGRQLEADALILCTAGATQNLPGLSWLPLRIVRGQVSFVRATELSQGWTRPHCHAGYLTPAMNGAHCVGATFDRKRSEPDIDQADDEANLAQLAEALPDHWRDLGGEHIEIIGRHAGVRCQSPDKLPLAGPLPDPTCNPHRINNRIWLNIAHGSRGATNTPLCADFIADAISGLPAPVDQSIVNQLTPERFIERRRRREPDWMPKDP